MRIETEMQTQVLQVVEYDLLAPTKVYQDSEDLTLFTELFISQIFTERLLCARYLPGP